jgi:hypothetical protein
MELKGIIHKIGDIETISDKFRKREIILKLEGEYPQHITCQLTNQKVDLFNGYVPGQEVNVSYNLRGKLYTNTQGEEKAITNIEIWKIN